MGKTSDIRWTTGAVLLALAAQKLRTGDSFTANQLGQWVPGVKHPGRMRYVTLKLQELGFVTAGQKLEQPADSTAPAALLNRYTLTATGAAAAKAAASGNVPKSGPKGQHSTTRVPEPGSLVARLWSLVRARKIIDSESAACTLMDAGDNSDIARTQATVSRYLNRWAKAGVLQEGALRVRGQGKNPGYKRYVLVTDVGPRPPIWTPTARAKAAAAEGSAA